MHAKYWAGNLLRDLGAEVRILLKWASKWRYCLNPASTGQGFCGDAHEMVFSKIREYLVCGVASLSGINC
jgi:hypothetical protein